MSQSYEYRLNNSLCFTDLSGAEPPQTINHSAFYNQYYIGYTYDDRVDYTGLGDPVCGHCWRTGHSLKLYQVIAGYSTLSMGSGWKPGQSGLTPIISQWAPDFGGPVRYVDNMGNERNALPSTLEMANRKVGYHDDYAVGQMIWNPWAGIEVSRDGGKVTYSGGWVRYSRSLANKIMGAGYALQAQGERPTFAGGIMFENIADGLKAMWLASQIFRGEGYKENLAVFTPQGLLVLPNTRNTKNNSAGSLSFFPLRFVDGKPQINWNKGGKDNWLPILGVVHTHPDPTGLQQHAPWERKEGRGDWLWTSVGLSHFIISHSLVSEGTFDGSIHLSTPLGPNNINTYQKVIDKFKKD